MQNGILKQNFAYQKVKDARGSSTFGEATPIRLRGDPVPSKDVMVLCIVSSNKLSALPGRKRGASATAAEWPPLWGLGRQSLSAKSASANKQRLSYPPIHSQFGGEGWGPAYCTALRISTPCSNGLNVSLLPLSHKTVLSLILVPRATFLPSGGHVSSALRSGAYSNLSAKNVRSESQVTLTAATRLNSCNRSRRLHAFWPNDRP